MSLITNIAELKYVTNVWYSANVLNMLAHKTYCQNN